MALKSNKDIFGLFILNQLSEMFEKDNVYGLSTIFFILFGLCLLCLGTTKHLMLCNRCDTNGPQKLENQDSSKV